MAIFSEPAAPLAALIRREPRLRFIKPLPSILRAENVAKTSTAATIYSSRL